MLSPHLVRQITLPTFLTEECAKILSIKRKARSVSAYRAMYRPDPPDYPQPHKLSLSLRERAGVRELAFM